MTYEKKADEPFNFKFPDEVKSLMQGALDLHCHGGPSLIPRRIDAVTAARQAAAAGLSAVLMKDHHLPTARDVLYAKEYVLKKEGLKVDLMGAIALNHSVGGINPYAVEVALFFGARIVYLPTVSSRSHREHEKKVAAKVRFPPTAKKLLETEPIYLLDQHGHLPPQLSVIMEQVRDADAILSMGHLSPPEIFAVLDLANDMGLRRLVVHHPTAIIEANESQIIDFTRKGAMIEFTACMTDPRSKFYLIPSEELSRLIRLIGIDSVFIASDLGQHDTPPFVEGLMVVADLLLGAGMRMEELRKLFRENPARLVY
jgi:hypothetical protein